MLFSKVATLSINLLMITITIITHTKDYTLYNIQTIPAFSKDELTNKITYVKLQYFKIRSQTDISHTNYAHVFPSLKYG